MMCDAAAWVSFMYASQCASGLLMLALSLASALYVWGRVFRILETVALVSPLSIRF